MRRFALFAAAGFVLSNGCGASPSAPTVTNRSAQVDGLSTVPATVPSTASPVLSTLTFSIDSACRSPFPESLHQRSYSASSTANYADTRTGAQASNDSGCDALFPALLRPGCPAGAVLPASF